MSEQVSNEVLESVKPSQFEGFWNPRMSHIMGKKDGPLDIKFL